MDEKKKNNYEMLGTNELPTDIEGGRILPINLVGEMKKSFISYAMAVIISRALPDVRDGLKPVHRRILLGAAVYRCAPPEKGLSGI